jgi:molecular chaperone GrpE (heat shock protein)
MGTWLLRLLGRAPTSARDEAPSDGDAGEEEGYDEPPPWAEELALSLQKSSRVQVRAGARLEELERKVEGGFADLRSAIAAMARTAAADGSSSPARWEALLDSIDLLVDVAASVDRQACPGLGEGLDAIVRRLGTFLEQESMVRVGARGMPLDGRVFRVVGTDDQPDLPEGVIARVVRAAVLRGDRVVREGQVITNRRTG